MMKARSLGLLLSLVSTNLNTSGKDLHCSLVYSPVKLCLRLLQQSHQSAGKDVTRGLTQSGITNLSYSSIHAGKTYSLVLTRRMIMKDHCSLELTLKLIMKDHCSLELTRTVIMKDHCTLLVRILKYHGTLHWNRQLLLNI